MISAIRQKKEGFQGQSVRRRISHMSLLRTVSVHSVAYSQQQNNLKRLLDDFHNQQIDSDGDSEDRDGPQRKAA